jgi:hypothetical protein|tara:strand:- start:428 stop:730 length:303 start_codon:yes stop_codon:yes gene_type:complete
MLVELSTKQKEVKMATIGQILGRAAVRKLKEKLYVPYCQHTHKPGDKCPHHCRPCPEFIEWQTSVHKAKEKEIEKRRKKSLDPVDRMFDAIFVTNNQKES